MRSTRFTAAIHVLAYLAECRNDGIPSYFIAAKLREDAGAARRLLQRLSRAGLVASHPGPGGGVRLCLSQADISLDRVYEAVMAPLSRAVGFHRVGSFYPLERHLGALLAPRLERGERAFLAELATTSVTDLMYEARRLSLIPGRLRSATSADPAL